MGRGADYSPSRIRTDNSLLLIRGIQEAARASGCAQSGLGERERDGEGTKSA